MFALSSVDVHLLENFNAVSSSGITIKTPFETERCFYMRKIHVLCISSPHLDLHSKDRLIIMCTRSIRVLMTS
ncbi:hypothetical protein HMPREF3293_01531 [Christensenella minuta]|uniref:Uncharacterized protein n=1 Tax=Christensenella minuta TaxID=626937 RepID=A0A136Q4N1_9FIRM|nr:hypothetical protein HMPREF3293_01531 [Christensenella minuta]